MDTVRPMEPDVEGWEFVSKPEFNGSDNSAIKKFSELSIASRLDDKDRVKLIKTKNDSEMDTNPKLMETGAVETQVVVTSTRPTTHMGSNLTHSGTCHEEEEEEMWDAKEDLPVYRSIGYCSTFTPIYRSVGSNPESLQ